MNVTFASFAFQRPNNLHWGGERFPGNQTNLLHEVAQQSGHHGLFVNRAAATAHDVREVRIPGSCERGALEGQARWSRKVIRGAEAPWDHAEAGGEAVGDLDAGPVEVAVIRERGSGLAQPREENAQRG